MKKKKKKSKRKFPFITVVILLAILLWIFWNKFQDLTTSVQNIFISGESEKPSQERISDQEREILEEILKRR